MVEAWEAILVFMNRYFDQSLEEKMKDSRKSARTGWYKQNSYPARSNPHASVSHEPVGTSGGAVDSSVDHYESLKVCCKATTRQSKLNLSPGLPARMSA